MKVVKRLRMILVLFVCLFVGNLVNHLIGFLCYKGMMNKKMRMN